MLRIVSFLAKCLKALITSVLLCKGFEAVGKKRWQSLKKCSVNLNLLAEEEQ